MTKGKVLIATGGTAGHIVPALSVAAALDSRGFEVHFLGGDRAEVTLVPEAGFPLHQIDAVGISRTSKKAAVKALAKVIPAFLSARKVIREVRPDVVMGGGGYIAGIGGAAALSARVPLVLTEADSHIGLSNRLLARFAKSVCLAFEIEGLQGLPYRVTGRPVPAITTDRAAARQRFGVHEDATCVLVTGGSLGARSINLAAIEAFADKNFEVIHLAGERDLPNLRSPRPDYHLLGYVDRFADAVLASDLAVARAGGSVFELAAQGCPAVLVPYPHAAGDHQTKNAQWMVDAGAAQLISDDKLTAERLESVVDRVLADRTRLGSMAAASASLARPNAADDVASAVIEAAGIGRIQG